MKKLNWLATNYNWTLYINLTPSDIKGLELNHTGASTIKVTSQGYLFSFPSKTRDLLDKTEIWTKE